MFIDALSGGKIDKFRTFSAIWQVALKIYTTPDVGVAATPGQGVVRPAVLISQHNPPIRLT